MARAGRDRSGLSRQAQDGTYVTCSSRALAAAAAVVNAAGVVPRRRRRTKRRRTAPCTSLAAPGGGGDPASEGDAADVSMAVADRAANEGAADLAADGHARLRTRRSGGAYPDARTIDGYVEAGPDVRALGDCMALSEGARDGVARGTAAAGESAVAVAADESADAVTADPPVDGRGADPAAGGGVAHPRRTKRRRGAARARPAASADAAALIEGARDDVARGTAAAGESASRSPLTIPPTRSLPTCPRTGALRPGRGRARR